MLALAQDAGWIALLILLYLCGLIAYGWYHSRRIRTQEDFAVAGRALGTPVLVGTLVATWMGTGSLIGNAQKTYNVGLAMLLIPLGSVLGLAVLSTVAARVRRFEQLTVQDIIESRFGLTPRVLSTIAIITAYLTIVSYQYRAGGAVIHTIFPQLGEFCQQALPGLDAWLQAHTAWNVASWGSVLAAIFIIGYTILGGLVSVAYTDVVNGAVMLVGVLLGIPYLYWQLGGAAGVEAVFAETPDKLQLLGPIDPVTAINYMLPALLLVMGEANLYQRFFAAKSVAAAKRAGVLLVFAVAVAEVAIILLAFLSSAAEPSLPKEQYGHVILIAAMHHMPLLLGTLVLGAAVAIIVSTADSFLLVSSNSLVRDVVHRFIAPGASPRSLVMLSRLTVLALGIVALFVSVFSDKFFEVALWAYTVYGASITPALLATFFWPRATTAGAAAGIAGGTTATVAWNLLLGADALPRFIAQFDAVLPAMAVSLVLLVGVSLLTPPPRPDKVARWSTS